MIGFVRVLEGRNDEIQNQKRGPQKQGASLEGQDIISFIETLVISITKF
jgi:hypothetical protein